MNDEFLFVEKYRPSTVSECILPDRLKVVFQSYVDNKSIPNLMLTGPPGVGKTSVAIAMCDEIGLNYIKINGSKERGIDTLRTKINNYASTVSIRGGRKVIIMDEADGMTAEAQDAFKGVIEEFSSNATFILTCNFKAKLIEAIHSRCAVIDFRLEAADRPKMASQFFKRLEEILTLENVTFDKAVLVKVVEKYFPDYRRTLNELQRLSTLGAIDISVLAQVTDIRKMSELVRYLKGSDFSGMRKWVVLNSDIDPTKIYRKVYDSLYDFLKPSSIPQVVVILAKYQYQAGFVPDGEINLVACLTEIMVDGEFL